MNPNSNDIYALIAKSLTDQLNEAELNTLEEWKSDSNENLQEYNDITELWIKSGSLQLPEPFDFSEAQNLVYQKAGIYSTNKKRWINWVVQAAAVLVLSFVFSGIYKSFNQSDQTQLVAKNTTKPVYQEIQSAFGTQVKVELSDGTKVFLNSGSKLRFPQTFDNQAQRTVFLDGEGYFDVTKNKEQPFVVQVNHLNIKVLGTKFNVDAYNDNKSISVALVEGSVVLQDHSEEGSKELMSLSPNQVATLDTTSQKLIKTDVPAMDKYTAWVNGRIVFFGDPIQTVVNKLSKWYNAEIVISDKRLENYRFTGTFINEPLEQVLNVLSLTSKMNYTIDPARKQSDNTITKRKVILKSKI